MDTARWEFSIAARLLEQGICGREYLVGNALTVADILAGHTLLWAKSARLSLESEALEDYLKSLLGREALRRAQTRAKTRTRDI